MNIYIHEVEKIEVGKIEKLSDLTFVRTLTIKTKNVTRGSFKFFSDNAKDLELKKC